MLPALILTAALVAQDAAPATQSAGQTSTFAVGVDSYHRNYEGPQTDQEARYDSGILSAYSSKEVQMGGLEGSWVVATADGRKLVGLELRSNNAGGQLDGAWRSMLTGYGMNNSGFVSNIALTGRDLEINYMPGRQRSPNILQVHKDADGYWRGSLLDVQGHKTAIVMSRLASGG